MSSFKNLNLCFKIVCVCLSLEHVCASRAERYGKNDWASYNSFFGPTALFRGKKVTIDCVVKPEENIDIKCEEFQGTGILSTSVIKIIVGTFSFSGIIECLTECIIISRVPVDRTKLTLKNPEKVTFIHNPHLEKIHQGGDIHFKR